jgi:hypothetical protein
MKMKFPVMLILQFKYLSFCPFCLPIDDIELLILRLTAVYWLRIVEFNILIWRLDPCLSVLVKCCTTAQFPVK